MGEKLKNIGSFIKRRRTPIAILAVLIAAVALGAVWWGDKAAASDYITGKVERTNIEVTVSATGTVQAVTTVQVGSQVSGTVAWLGADFNSNVKRGDVIARLDPALFQAQVENAKANVVNAEAAVQAAETEIVNQRANLAAARANLEVTRVQRDDAIALVKRYQEIKAVLSGRDLEAAQAQANAASARYDQAAAQVGQSQAANESVKSRVAQAKASLAQAKAQLQQSSVNLQHATIASPIDGVVVSRNVDVGQTVAASMQAPTLFTIANDLQKMQVLASIDEADVGQIKQGIKANFLVDAYPGEPFQGEITQLRLNAQTLQNVVTYSAVIEVANTDLKLRPGMTANITIPVARRDNVLALPNAALRFRPNLTEEQLAEIRKQTEARMQQRREERAAAQQEQAEEKPAEQEASGAQTAAKPQDEGRSSGEGGRRMGADREGRRRDGSSGAGGEGGRRDGSSGAVGRREGSPGTGGEGGRRSGGPGGGGARQGQMVWVLAADGKTLEQRFVRTGLTNGRLTEILFGELNEGDTVIIGQNETNGNRAPQQPGAPFGQRPPGGPGGGRGPR